MKIDKLEKGGRKKKLVGVSTTQYWLEKHWL